MKNSTTIWVSMLINDNFWIVMVASCPTIFTFQLLCMSEKLQIKITSDLPWIVDILALMNKCVCLICKPRKKVTLPSFTFRIPCSWFLQIWHEENERNPKDNIIHVYLNNQCVMPMPEEKKEFYPPSSFQNCFWVCRNVFNLAYHALGTCLKLSL